MIYTEDYFFGGNTHGGYVDYDTEKAVMRPTLARYLDLVEQHIAKGVLLDVGAATGYFLLMAKERGWETLGVEMSDAAAERGRTQGLRMYTGTLDQAPIADATCDAVTMIDVLEHTIAPKELVNRVHRILRPGGVLLVNTPDAGSVFARILGKYWHLLCPPEHLVYFNRKNIITLLREEGFEVLSVGTIGKRFTIQYILNTVSRWLSIPLILKIAQRVDGTRFGTFSLSLNLFDNMFVLAQKKD
jgi:SAM-dependent methyltransferase